MVGTDHRAEDFHRCDYVGNNSHVAEKHTDSNCEGCSNWVVNVSKSIQIFPSILTMTKKTINTFVAICSVLAVVSCQKSEHLLYEKLQGVNNIELENSAWGNKYNNMMLNGGAVIISNNAIDLPTVSYRHDTMGREHLVHYDSLKAHPELKSIYDRQTDSLAIVNHQRLNDAQGTWKIISTAPDSIFIDAPNHPMHGSYLIEFFYDEDGWPEGNAPCNKYKFILLNEKDEKYFVFNRVGFIYVNVYRHWTD